MVRVLPPGRAADLLHGVPFGQPAHPAVVRLPIGCWTSAVLLDWLGGRGREAERASATLIAAGVAAAGSAPATPTAMSVADARSASRPRPPSQSSSTAEVQQPMGSRTAAGWAGWPNGTPCSRSTARLGGRARTTALETARTGPSRAVARSMRSASGLS